MSSVSGPIRIGVVGAGQIARVQHIPTLQASRDFALVALADPVAKEAPEGAMLFPTMEAMLAGAELDAVALCTPPQIRYALARQALEAGLHVLLEKPPAQTVSEVRDLEEQAGRAGRTLFAAWHSMFSGAVEPARRILADTPPVAMQVVWKEDCEKWHPGVDWFWEPGGMGVFDPGVNALSIVVATLPEPIFVRTASFAVPETAQTPVRAELSFATASCAEGFSMSLDWDHRGDETWSIRWTLADGRTLLLERGGAALSLDGDPLLAEQDQEYARLYAHFATLIREGRSDAEVRPLQLATDAFSLARIEPTAPFRGRRFS